ncbi:hypothetical protein Tco_1096962, partial [Tanacetum coccineum]
MYYLKQGTNNQYAVLVRKVDTSYSTGEYAVSVRPTPNSNRIFWIQRIDLQFIVVLGEVQARIRRIFLVGYGVLACSIIFFTSSWIWRIGSSGYSVLIFNSLWYLVKCRPGYAVFSLLDMAYWLSKSLLKSREEGFQRQKPGAKAGSKEILTGSKSKATKIGSSKEPSGSKSGQSKKVNVSSSALDINPSQPPASTHVDAGMHKEDPQATSGPKSLGITGEERGHPQLSSGMSASLFNKPIFSDSFIIHFESTSGNDALEDSTAEVDPRKSNPHDSIPQQQGIDEGSKRYSLDHIFVGTDPNVLTDQTKSVSEGLETVLTEPVTRKGANTSKPKYEDISFEET